MATSDCVVQNAGGFSSLEALASGTPVITYRPLPGHGIANSANLEAAGLVPWARHVDELALLLAEARTAPRLNRLPADAPEVLTMLTGDSQLVAAA
jgi:UDP-N-acetylglucosamine:LPS N-acetylglucosamine transferase